MAVPEVSFSELIQHPRDTVAALRASRSRSVRLHRRDDEDLLLITASRAEQNAEMTSVATGLLEAFADDESGRAQLRRILPRVFPWARYLPDGDVDQFVVEILDALHVAGSMDSPVALTQAVTEWRHTAEVHADPELRDVVRATTGDFGAVPAPPTG